MNPSSMTARMIAAVLWFGAAGPVARAQSALCVEYQGRTVPVYRVHNGYAYVKDGGKLVSVKPTRSSLVEVEEFLPVFVAVRNVEVKTSHVEMLNTADQLNQEFHFRGTFETSYLLKDVFLVLELFTEKSGKRLFFQEVGDLAPRESQWINVVVALPEALGAGHYKMHVFAGGREVFHSLQPWEFREAALNKLVAKRVAGIHGDALPQPLVGPAPEYPAALRKAGAKGEATVSVRITSRGAVFDPAVESATDPAFGAAALAAVKEWRFLPRVKDGRAVEARLAVPFAFEPPADARKK